MAVENLFESFRSVTAPGSPVRRRAGELAREVAGVLVGVPELERARVELGEAASEGVARDTSGAVLGGLVALAGLVPLGGLARAGRAWDVAGDVVRGAEAARDVARKLPDVPYYQLQGGYDPLIYGTDWSKATPNVSLDELPRVVADDLEKGRLRLFHATYSANVDSILKNGIQVNLPWGERIGRTPDIRRGKWVYGSINPSRLRQFGDAIVEYSVPRSALIDSEFETFISRAVEPGQIAAVHWLDNDSNVVKTLRVNESLGSLVDSSGVARLDVGGDVTRAGRLQPSLLRAEGGLFEAELSGDRVQDLAGRLAQRQLDSPLGLAAVEPREIAAALNEVPEFRQFLRLYRDRVSKKRKVGSFAGVEERPELLEFARRAGLSTPSRAGRGPEMSLDAMLARVEDGAVVGSDVRAAALNLGTRIRNSAAFLTEDIYTPSFYVEFNRILKAVEGRTGMPTLTFSNGLAAASAQAAPYDEMLRMRRVAPLVEYRDGRAYFPKVEEIKALGPGNHPLYPAFKADGTPGGVDSMAVMAGRGLADSINNPNMLAEQVFGLAAKTTPYAYLRYDPAYGLAYVSDTVDGLGQFLIRGELGKIDTTPAKAAVQNQFAGRMLAEIYGVPASNVQEAVWAYIRVARDGFLRPKKGGWAADAIAPSFRGGAGSAEDVLVETVEALDPRLVRLAKENHERFVAGVRSGSEPGWRWDASRGQPVIESESYLIRPTDRTTAAGKPTAAPDLQRAMLEAVAAAGPVLRGRLLALAASAGIPLSVLVEALGDSANDIPVEVINA